MTKSGVAPVGELFEIALGDQRAVVSELGATLRAYDVGGRPVIESFDGPEVPMAFCEGEILAPWPNRVVDGRWSHDGVERQLAITEPARGHALHGLVRNLAWRVVKCTGARVELDVDLLAHQGWPFPLHMAASYELAADGLHASITAINVGRIPAPYGVAVHPYLHVPGGRVDDIVLHIPAASYLEVDERLAPKEKRPVAGTPFDLTNGKPLGDRQIDNGYTDTVPGAAATMTAPDGRTTTMWADESVSWWQLFTGDALPGPWRRRSIALEPMTCAPDALNSGDGLVVLAPGESHTMTWGLALSES